MSFTHQIGDSPLDYGGLSTEQEIMRLRMEAIRERAEQPKNEPQPSQAERLTMEEVAANIAQKNVAATPSLQISPTEFVAILVKSARTPIDWLILIIILISVAVALDTVVSSMFREYMAPRRDGGNFCGTCGGVV